MTDGEQWRTDAIGALKKAGATEEQCEYVRGELESLRDMAKRIKKFEDRRVTSNRTAAAD